MSSLSGVANLLVDLRVGVNKITGHGETRTQAASTNPFKYITTTYGSLKVNLSHVGVILFSNSNVCTKDVNKKKDIQHHYKNDDGI